MTTFIETERLILRELITDDENNIFALDSDPEVHTYLGKNPITTMEQSRNVIQSILQQYIDNKIGRWAVIEKSSGDFIGWSGLKLVKTIVNNQINYYDLGYRFIKRYWGKGYATETAKASLTYGFNIMELNEIYGMADCENIASNNVLKKAGLRFTNMFEYEGSPHTCYKITRDEWMEMR